MYKTKIYLFVMLIVLNIFDCLTTTIVLNSYGTQAELNPTMRYIIEQVGLSGMWWAKAIIILPLGFFINRLSEEFFVILNLVFTLIVAINLVGLTL